MQRFRHWPSAVQEIVREVLSRRAAEFPTEHRALLADARVQAASLALVTGCEHGAMTATGGHMTGTLN